MKKRKRKQTKNLKRSVATSSNTAHIIGRHWDGYSIYTRVDGSIENFIKKARELREERHQGKFPTSFTVDLVD